MVREDFLQQNAFADVDSFSSYDRQEKLLAMVLRYDRLCREAISKGAPVAFPKGGGWAPPGGGGGRATGGRRGKEGGVGGGGRGLRSSSPFRPVRRSAGPRAPPRGKNHVSPTPLGERRRNHPFWEEGGETGDTERKRGPVFLLSVV